jgi:hypothetical protein
MSMQKGDNGKMSFAFDMWKQLRWIDFKIMHGIQFLFYFFSWFHKSQNLQICVNSCNCVNIM